MTERDAFGNPAREDTRAGLRPEPRSASTPLKVPDTTPLTGSDPLRGAGAQDLRGPAGDVWPPPPRRRRRGGGIAAALTVAALVIAGAGALAVVGGTGGAEAVRDAGVPAVVEQGSGEQPAPEAERRRPLLSSRGFASALRRAGAGSRGGRLKLVRLAPDRMDAQFARPDGGLDLVQVKADGARQVIRTAGGTGGTPPLRIAAIDTRAPGRLVGSAAERLGRKPSSVDYLVLLNIGRGPRWSVYFKGGRAFLADVRGRITQRIS
jgi:hypothetical protein